MTARARAQPVPRYCARAVLVALVLIGLPDAVRGDEIGLHERGSAERAEGPEKEADAKQLELLVGEQARRSSADDLLESILVELRCLAFQPRSSEEPEAGPGLAEGGSFEAEFAGLFEPPEVYRSGIAPELLAAVARRIVGADGSGALDGSKARVRGLPSPLAVSGWGSPGAPLIAYVPRAETPVDLVGDMRGAGALVVDGNLNVWGSFHYVGVLLVLGQLAVMEGADISVRGLPFFAGELRVFHGGDFQVTARDADLTLIRRTLQGLDAFGLLPVPQIERVEGATDEQDCPSTSPGT